MFFKKHSSKPVEIPAPTPKRSPETSHTQTSNTQTSHGNSPYQPLRQDVDSIRLIRIHPARNDTDPIVCDMTEAAVGDRPCYEALSYTWGSEGPARSITLNGVKKSVGPNLLDALVCLRRRGHGTSFWVDALCINQEDLPERNRQLRLMSQIYFRADIVVVWLGQKYTKYQSQISKARSSSEKTIIERQMAKDLLEDGYWNRLWIIQEVGRANKLQVCFGVQTMTWESFMAFVKSHSTREQGPLKLSRQVDRKYAGSHRLRDLLYTHRHALCKDPRDKIFGLVGFAFDAAEFPVDYGKSEMEVWVDTMEFMNSHNMFEGESDIIHYGSLIKFLLMGNQSPHAQKNLLRYHANAQLGSNIIEEGQRPTDNAKVFHLRGAAVGQILSVGPSVQEAAGSLKKVDEWNAAMKQNFGDDLGLARQEGDALLETIFSFRGKALEALSFDQGSQVRWMDENRSSRDQRGTLMGCYTSGIDLERGTRLMPQAQRPPSAGSVLCQIRGPRSREVWRTGLTTSQARQEDIVFWVRGTKKAVLLRVEQGGRDGSCSRILQVCGTAMVSQDIISDRIDHQKRMGVFKKDDELSLRMDAGTIFALLPEGYQQWN